MTTERLQQESQAEGDSQLNPVTKKALLYVCLYGTSEGENRVSAVKKNYEQIHMGRDSHV